MMQNWPYSNHYTLTPQKTATERNPLSEAGTVLNTLCGCDVDLKVQIKVTKKDLSGSDYLS